MVVRTLRSQDVCALGSSLRAVRPNLNGVFLVTAADDFEARESLASQVIREVFEGEPGFELTRVEYGLSLDELSIIVAYVDPIRRLTQEEVVGLESRLQDQFDNPTMHFYIRVNATPLLGRDGPIQVEWSNARDAEPDRAAELPEIEQAIRHAVAVVLNREPLRVHFRWTGEHWRALVEVLGVSDMTPEFVTQIRQALPKQIAKEVEMLIWRRSDFVVTESGFTDYDTLVEPYISRQTEKMRGLFRTDVGTQESVTN